MRKRDLTEDNYNLAIAIKQGSQETLNWRFQEFWKERCGNDSYLSDMETYNVLQYSISEMFVPHEMAAIFNEMGRFFYWSKEDISLEKMNELFLRAIHGIKMMFDE